MNEGHLRTWLRKIPQPVAVLADDKRIEVPRTPRGWSELATSLVALAPTKLTCLDANNTILRCKTFDEEKEDDTPREPDSEIAVFAKLIAQAYEQGTKSYAPLLDSAMQFIERQGQRLAKAESEIERLRLANARLNGIVAELEAAPAEQADSTIMGALVQGALAAQAQDGVTPLKQVKK